MSKQNKMKYLALSFSNRSIDLQNTRRYKVVTADERERACVVVLLNMMSHVNKIYAKQRTELNTHQHLLSLYFLNIAHACLIKYGYKSAVYDSDHAIIMFPRVEEVQPMYKTQHARNINWLTYTRYQYNYGNLYYGNLLFVNPHLLL